MLEYGKGVKRWKKIKITVKWLDKLEGRGSWRERDVWKSLEKKGKENESGKRVKKLPRKAGEKGTKTRWKEE